MAIRCLIVTVLLVSAFIQQTEAGIIDGIKTVAELFIDLIELVIKIIATGVTDIFYEIFNPPENKNSSVQYLLFTKENPNKTCFLEPNLKALQKCPFNATYPMKILIHGFNTNLGNSSLFWPIKDQLLALYDYNVILVNWTNYNDVPYTEACSNTVPIGNEVAELIQFLQNNTELEAKDIHFIGHSLGAHLSGIAARQIPGAQRVTGLDPAAPGYYPIDFFPALNYTDANFVDVIHSSNLTSGFGISAPIGDIDFYPNGGTHQPQCQTVGVNDTGHKSLYTGSCNHKASLGYFLESINTTKCIFQSTMCSNYTSFLDGLCSNNSSPMAEMGLPAQPIFGLGPKSKFYLRTHVYEPYCDKYGYEP